MSGSFSLPDGAQGVLPSQLLGDAVASGVISAADGISADAIQPASVDLRLGDVAYRLRSSFLPGRQSVQEKLDRHLIDTLDLTRDEGAVLEAHRPYLVPLVESLRLPPNVRARANPKSSTGRLDVFTRVVTDRGEQFDDIEAGYEGPLYVEIVPLSFTIRVRRRLALNQLRLIVGHPRLSDDEIADWHQRESLLYRESRPVPEKELAADNGLFLSLDLRGDREGKVGYRARDYAPVVDLWRNGEYRASVFWDPVISEDETVVLAPERFYLLLSDEEVSVPPGLAAEMTAYDPTSGELRTHYAGFFDPGFGYDRSGIMSGSKAALEVRAHTVPFVIERGQWVCRLTFEHMLAAPEKLYGIGIGSSYQGQSETLSKHFRRAALGQPRLIEG